MQIRTSNLDGTNVTCTELDEVSPPRNRQGYIDMAKAASEADGGKHVVIGTGLEDDASGDQVARTCASNGVLTFCNETLR